MEPRPVGRGMVVHDQTLAAGLWASMEPRPVGRGMSTGLGLVALAGLRQWSRGRLAAECE